MHFDPSIFIILVSNFAAKTFIRLTDGMPVKRLSADISIFLLNGGLLYNNI
ncbi:hypothetical protein [Nostoc sp.]|uniref:hypothetical protein n=1 Tax=Nostoc sp. TaxID=1180 RepID=UPI002FFCDF7E